MTEPTEGEGEGTWAKLRRRKVVQWGIAYAAKRLCRSCGADVPLGTKYCLSCGQPVSLRP